LPFLNNSNYMPNIILASRSPRRKALLELIGLTFNIITSTVDELFDLDLSPSDFATHYAEKKSREISLNNPNSIVIGADTIVAQKDKILGKPTSYNKAFSMLSGLSGKTHSVYTGVSLQWGEKSMSHTFHSKTDVTIKTLTKEEIEFYIENYKPFDKAGSYGIQDWFSVCVEKIEGCYFNVMGLPLNKLYKKLETILSD